jgi:hypothetical protein
MGIGSTGSGKLMVQGLRAEVEADEDHDEGYHLKEKGAFGHPPVNDEKEYLDNGDQQASKPPPDAHAKGGDQKPEAANQEYQQAQKDQCGASEFHDLQLDNLEQQCQRGMRAIGSSDVQAS